MAVRGLLKVIGIIFLSILIFAVLFLWLFDFGALKPNIERLVSNATEREFRINGTLSVRILPTPKVLAEQVSLTGPSWSTDPKMLEAGKAYIEVKFFPLIHGKVVVKNLEINDVRVLVETDTSGKLNWDFAKKDSPEPQTPPEDNTSGKEQPLVIESAQIKNVLAIYRQPEAEDMRFSIESFVVNKTDEDTTQFNGQGQAFKQVFDLAGAVSQAHTDLNVNFGKLKLVSKYDYPDDSVDIKASVGRVAEIGQMLEIENLPDEDLNVTGNVSVADNKINFRQFEIALSGLKLSVDGSIDGESKQAQLSVKASGEKLSYLKPDLPAIPFSLQSDISMAGDVIDLAPYSVKFGESNISGKANLETGEITKIKIEAKSDLIDLSPFAPEEPADKKNTTEAPPKSEPPARYVFEETPLPFEKLQSLNVNIDADIARLVFHNSEFKNFVFKGDAENGTLKFSNTFENKKSGKFDSKVSIKVANTKADLSVITKVRDFKLELLSGETVPANQIPSTALDINLRSSGASPRTLAANLNGTVVVDQGPGKVSNKLISRFSGDIISQLFSALNPFSKKEEFTNWDCSLFAINFESGEGDINGFLLQSEKLMVVGGGKIDLNDETLKIEFNTKPRKGVGVSADMFVTPFVKLTGTLAKPSVGLNNKGVLLSGGAAVLTGGLSFLYTGLMDRVTAEGGRCEKARAEIQKTASAIPKEK